MTSKEALEKICLHCEHYHQDMCFRAIAGCEEWHKLEKDLEKLELYEKVFPKMQEDGAYYKGQYYKQREILEILKEKAYLYQVNENPKVASIQINITTLDVNFNEIKEWLKNEE